MQHESYRHCPAATARTHPARQRTPRIGSEPPIFSGLVCFITLSGGAPRFLHDVAQLRRRGQADVITQQPRTGD
jgi:hypothetical protein